MTHSGGFAAALVALAALAQGCAPRSSFGSRAYDAWLTTKVKTRLIYADDLDSAQVKIVSANSAVYLMGLVTRKEADLATEAASSVDGAARVVKVFEYID